LEAEPIAVNNFTQSTQSAHGPKLRASVPPQGSLLGALHRKVDEIVAKYELAGTCSENSAGLNVPQVLPATHVLDTLVHPQDAYGFFSFLTISDMVGVTSASAWHLANTPDKLRQVITFRRVVVKFVWSRAFDALVRQVSPRMSEKLACVNAVYKYFELTDMYAVSRNATKLLSGDRQKKLVCPLGEFI
jgi:hypothetical protein